MSEKPSPEVQPEAPVPAKPRKIIKINDVKGRPPYGNRFGDDVRLTQPTRADVKNAIDACYFEERPFSGNQKALFDEWCAASNGGTDRSKFIEVATRYHAGRIAKLVRDGWTDPIGVSHDDIIHDGLHRLLAAEFRGDVEIEAEIG